MSAKKLTFKTKLNTDSAFEDTKYLGICEEHPHLVAKGPTQSAALHRIKKMVKDLSIGGMYEQKPLTYAPPHTVVEEKPKLLTPKVNHVIFVVDVSGSMGSLMQKLPVMVNENLDVLRAESTDIKTLVSIYSFDHDFKVVKAEADVHDRSLIINNYELINRGGGTALRDAVMKASDSVKGLNIPGVDESFLVITLTDGQDEHSKAGILHFSSFYSAKTSKGNWTFSFLVPPGAKNTTVSRLGVPAGNVTEWELTTQGLENASKQTSSALRGYYGSRRSGAKASTTFYVDSSNIDLNQVKRNLVNINSKVRVLDVINTSEIAPFCNSNGLAYQSGKAYYQLAKREKVQGHKMFMLLHNKTGAIYAGQDARDLLGLPSGDVNLAPGNNTEYTIFVQSTSVNRKLFAGSKVLYFIG